MNEKIKNLRKLQLISSKLYDAEETQRTRHPGKILNGLYKFKGILEGVQRSSSSRTKYDESHRFLTALSKTFKVYS